MYGTVNMVSQDTTIVILLKYFVDATPVVEGGFLKNQVLMARGDWGPQGSK